MQPTATLIIPTFEEEGNIGPLLGDVHTVLADAGVAYQVIVMDDSPTTATVDAAHEAAAELCGGACEHLQVDIIQRDLSNRDTLSGAVIDGVSKANAGIVIVMDGDRQHPAETLPNLIAGAHTHNVVVASRYIKGGSSNGLSGVIRRMVSRSSTRLASAILRQSLRGVTDPMTGFFAFQRDAVSIDTLNRRGFKILVSILASNASLSRTETAFKMQKRTQGHSKGNLKQGIAFILQLIELRRAGAS